MRIRHEENLRKKYCGFQISELELLFNKHMDPVVYDWNINKLFQRITENKDGPYFVDKLNDKRTIFLK